MYARQKKFSNELFSNMFIITSETIIFLLHCSLVNTFSQALDFGKEVCVVFCDISKAFDRVWHEGLLKELEAAGIAGDFLYSFVLI